MRALPGNELTLLRCTPVAITMDSTLDETILVSTPGIFGRLDDVVIYQHLTHHALYLL